MIKAIGAHIYAGGFTVGVSKHFDVTCHLEHAAYGSDVVKLNFPEMPIHAGGPSAWPASWPRSGPNRPRFLFANPPCAIWSGASHGRAVAWQDDPRLQFHHDIFHYAMDVADVDVFAMESVPPSWTKGRPHFDALAAEAGTRGYSTTVATHNAKWLGAAQNRSRIFYVFHKIAIEWDHPEYTEPMTVRQAFKGLGKAKKSAGYDTTLPRKFEHLISHAKPGEGLAKVFMRMYPDPPLNARGQIAGKPSFLDCRLPWDKPANVVIAGKPIHPELPRYASQEEVAAVCGFPPDYKWPKGDFNTITGYMSRGVMPPVGEWLASNVKAALERGKRLNSTSYAVLDVASPPGNYYLINEE